MTVSRLDESNVLPIVGDGFQVRYVCQFHHPANPGSLHQFTAVHRVPALSIRRPQMLDAQMLGLESACQPSGESAEAPVDPSIPRMAEGHNR